MMPRCRKLCRQKSLYNKSNCSAVKPDIERDRCGFFGQTSGELGRMVVIELFEIVDVSIDLLSDFITSFIVGNGKIIDLDSTPWTVRRRNLRDLVPSTDITFLIVFSFRLSLLTLTITASFEILFDNKIR